MSDPVAGFYGEDLQLIGTAEEYPFTVPEGTAWTLMIVGGSTPKAQYGWPGFVQERPPCEYCHGTGWYSPHGGEYGGRRCPNKCEVR
jgi:hypothetical protein